jgi:hypothetical protein
MAYDFKVRVSQKNRLDLGRKNYELKFLESKQNPLCVIEANAKQRKQQTKIALYFY